MWRPLYIVFELFALVLQSADDGSIHDGVDVVKWTIILATLMAATYRSCSLVVILDIRSAKMTMGIVHGQHASCCRR